ncbi:CLUMA_CG007612, isoform A [Clunio marinus]|uniref:CLUMA_CG007612, isoform A n=1 Tax=Clunio marinus TaxID=568069 RepID=A0A1J1I6P6_9DIPT|nr:CLUMA_CG007612, isoform A [Clunio marinus]
MAGKFICEHVRKGNKKKALKIEFRTEAARVEILSALSLEYFTVRSSNLKIQVKACFFLPSSFVDAVNAETIAAL